MGNLRVERDYSVQFGFLKPIHMQNKIKKMRLSRLPAGIWRGRGGLIRDKLKGKQ